jgi:hypothetical protein
VPKPNLRRRVERWRKPKWNLQRVRQFCKENGYWPSAPDLCRYFGPPNFVDRKWVFLLLQRLQRAGMLQRVHGRRWALTPQAFEYLKVRVVVATEKGPPRPPNYAERKEIVRKRHSLQRKQKIRDAYAIFEKPAEKGKIAPWVPKAVESQPQWLENLETVD